MSTPVGALKTLMLMLEQSDALTGVSIAFGEESVRAEEFPLPYVAISPQSGSWVPGGSAYYRSPPISFVQRQPGDIPEDPYADVNVLWSTIETIKLVLWAASSEADATRADHADEVEYLRARVLRALQYQTITGLKYVPVSGQWILADNAMNRYGRAYELIVTVEVTITDEVPVLATIETVEFNPIEITEG